jgi:gamma-glutamylcyclotransferase (GGCT)/AIG2-like uncharacterized protein YtfP
MLLAVYGTLRKNGGANVMLRLLLAEYIGRGKVYGYKMFALSCPFAVKSDNPRDAIVVEVYEVSDDKVPILDFYERGYERVKVSVELEDGRKITAWMYEWKDLEILKDCELIACGDWVEHIAGRCKCVKV